MEGLSILMWEGNRIFSHPRPIHLLVNLQHILDDNANPSANSQKQDLAIDAGLADTAPDG
jgi:hypothetical protein